MPIESKYTRCEPDDPNRCQGSGQRGQCEYLAEQRPDGTYYKYCVRHLGGTRKREEQQRMRNYRLDRFQARMEEFAENDAIKSLREEVGIARMLLEEVIRKCQDSDELLLASNRISELTARIEKLVMSCHRLEQSSGMLLDKASILRLADTIVDIIGKHDLPGDVVTTIATELVAAITSMKGEDDKS